MDIVAPGALGELALAAAYGSACNAFTPHPYLLIDIDGDGAGTVPATVLDWLQRLACPVIGIGGDDSALARACDVVVEDAAAAASMLENIERAPVAAMTLMQVLRITAAMPMADAMVVESLAFATLQGGTEFARWSSEHPPHPETIPGDDGPAVRVHRDGDCLYLRLNRPSSRNAMTIEMRDALVEALELAAVDSDIAEVRISGSGACFSTGGALEEFGTAISPASAHLVRSIRLPAAALLRTRARSHVHVHGACIGSGMEFPLFAQRVSASANAFFQLPEIRFGLIPGAGGCISIARRIGRQRTAYLALSGRRIKAATALQWGLVDSIEDPPSWAA